jgi:hypothetical protein
MNSSRSNILRIIDFVNSLETSIDKKNEDKKNEDKKNEDKKNDRDKYFLDYCRKENKKRQLKRQDYKIQDYKRQDYKRQDYKRQKMDESEEFKNYYNLQDNKNYELQKKIKKEMVKYYELQDRLEDPILVKLIKNEEDKIIKWQEKEEDMLSKLKNKKEDIFYKLLSSPTYERDKNYEHIALIEKEEDRLINIIDIKKTKRYALSLLKYKSYDNVMPFCHILKIETDIKYFIIDKHIIYMSKLDIRKLICMYLDKNNISSQCRICRNAYKYPHFQQNYIPIIVNDYSKFCIVCNFCVKKKAEKYYENNIGAAVSRIKKEYITYL